MRITISLLTAATIASSLAAQSHAIWFYPEGTTQGSTSFTSKSGVASGNFGDILQIYHPDYFAEVGQVVDPSAGLVRRCWGWNCIMQDQDSLTVENYYMRLYGEDPASPGNPDPAFANLLLDTGPILTPGGAGGAAAWRVISTLLTPYDMPGLVWSAFGMEPSALWTADGVSLHMTILGFNANTSVWDLPKLAWPNSGFTMPYWVRANDWGGAAPGAASIGTLATGLTDRTVHLGLLVDDRALTLNMGSAIDPALRGGGDNPTFGAGGALPDHNAPRFDGIAARMSCPGEANNLIFVLGTWGFGTGNNFNWPIPMGQTAGLEGVISLCGLNGSPLVQFYQGSLSATGFANPVMIAFPNGWGIDTGYWNFQAIVANPGTGRLALSNGSGFNAAN